jgi:hypothetical protein
MGTLRRPLDPEGDDPLKRPPISMPSTAQGSIQVVPPDRPVVMCAVDVKVR